MVKKTLTRAINTLLRRLLFIHVLIGNLFKLPWYSQPLCSQPLASTEEYMRLWEWAKGVNHKDVDKYEQECGIALDLNWLEELALQTQITIKKSPTTFAHGRVLYTALASYVQCNRDALKNTSIVVYETGTARGFSSLCMAKVFSDLKQKGQIITFDVLPHDHAMFWNCIADCDTFKKSRRELLKRWECLMNIITFVEGDTRITLPKVKNARINFAFLDGAHTFEDIVFEVSQIVGCQLDGDVIVFDDYNVEQFPGLVRGIDHICEIFKYKKNIIGGYGGRNYVIAVKIPIEN